MNKMNKPLIIANWKMNHSAGEALRFAIQFLARSLPPPEKVEICICPPFTSLPALREKLRNSSVKVGAQNTHWESSGAYTGEVSPDFLNECGCSYVIVGHSERREIFGETDETINHKLAAVLNRELAPIFCVGEKKKDRKEEKTFEVIGRQMERGLEGISVEKLLRLVVAYEPVWAIGTGDNAAPEQAQEVHLWIRKWLEKKFGKSVSEVIRIVYGGSVKEDNIASLMRETDINGALVGGASLTVDSLIKIVTDAVVEKK